MKKTGLSVNTDTMKMRNWFQNAVLLRQFEEGASVRKAMLIGFLLRIVPVMVWLSWPCVRDECTYLRLSERILDGDGMTASNGWIWAPGYPVLVSIHEWFTGYGAGIKTTQCIASAGVMVLLFHLSRRFANAKVGRVAVWMYALSPTQIFFAQSLWSECLYGGLLLLGVWFFEQATTVSSGEQETSGLKKALLTGVLVGICVLFRGVATYMLPIFCVALIWRRWTSRIAWKQSVVLIFGTVLMVGPYSTYASKKFGSFMISDRTLGQMMWLGNNDFEPIAFDWGNGPLSNLAFERHTKSGREPCAKKKQPVARDKCQTKAGIDWIKSNPQTFIERVPLRIAQMMNPHSFLTRHLRWGNMQGIPRWVDEAIIAVNVAWNLMILWLGTIGLVLYGHRGKGLLVSGIWLYHVAAISLLAGLTRYRVPLEPLLMIYAGWFVVNWGSNWQNASTPRKVSAVIFGALVVFFTMWFFPTGWVQWRHW